MKTSILKKKLKTLKPRSKVKAPPTKAHRNKKMESKYKDDFYVDMRDLCA